MTDTDTDTIEETASVAELVRLATREDWMQRGACRGLASDLFFPDRGAEVKQQKAVCAACPVSAECLDYALRNGEKFGIWGGTSERERRRLRREAGTTYKPGPAPRATDAQVAATALVALACGRRVLSAITSSFDVTEITARHLLTKARKAGFEIPYDYRGRVA